MPHSHIIGAWLCRHPTSNGYDNQAASAENAVKGDAGGQTYEIDANCVCVISPNNSFLIAQGMYFYSSLKVLKIKGSQDQKMERSRSVKC